MPYVLPVALFVAVMLLQGLFRKLAPGAGSPVLDVSPGDPRPERVRPAPPPDVSAAEGRPALSQEPATSRRVRAPDPLPAHHEPIAPDAGHRVRRLLAHAEGRRVALLVHEVFRPPEGCGRA
ncbi:MAG: hypothetical protein EHM24_29280 [Acidobacteria bacterium]|nr:MAG: hypothetical protein EHM24_29280 [Acidobacteriota bacterium]